MATRKKVAETTPQVEEQPTENTQQEHTDINGMVGRVHPSFPQLVIYTHRETK